MKNFCLIVLMLALTFLGNLQVVKSQDIILDDSDDYFEILTPTPKVKLDGVEQISWLMFDDDQTEIPYSVRLFDYDTCRTTYYGNLTNDLSGNSSKTIPNTLNWNSTFTQTINPLPDGRYCLQICAAFENGDAPYSACNVRKIRIYNNNSLPQIRSIPENFVLEEGQRFSYQIVATDPDGDSLQYRFVQTANFLSLNPQTGQISSAPLRANGFESLVYEITIAVDDQKSGEVRQTFQLTILGPKKEKPHVDNKTPQSPDQDGVDQEDPFEAEIISPTENSVFSDSRNRIEWNTNNPNYIESIQLRYTQNLEEYTNIINLDGEATSYEWDVSNLEDGFYYIDIIFELEQGDNVVLLSDSFEIANQPASGETGIVQIINVSPANQSEIDISDEIEISGEFVPPSNQEIDEDSFILRLNDSEIESCSVDLEGFICNVENINSGVNTLNIEVKTQEESAGLYEGSFVVIDENETIDSPGENDGETEFAIFGRTITISGILLIGLITFIAFLVIAIPLVLISMFKNRDSNSNLEDSTVANTTDANINYYYPTNSSSATNSNTYYEPPSQS